MLRLQDASAIMRDINTSGQVSFMQSMMMQEDFLGNEADEQQSTHDNLGECNLGDFFFDQGDN